MLGYSIISSTFFTCSGSITGGVGENGGCDLAGTLVIRFNLTGVPAVRKGYCNAGTHTCTYIHDIVTTHPCSAHMILTNQRV